MQVIDLLYKTGVPIAAGSQPVRLGKTLKINQAVAITINETPFPNTKTTSACGTSDSPVANCGGVYANSECRTGSGAYAGAQYCLCRAGYSREAIGCVEFNECTTIIA